MIQQTADSRRQTALILALDVDSYIKAKHFVDLLSKSKLMPTLEKLLSLGFTQEN